MSKTETGKTTRQTHTTSK